MTSSKVAAKSAAVVDAAEITTEIVVPEAQAKSATCAVKPKEVELIGLIHSVLSEASVLIRLGFRFCPVRTPEIYGVSGNMSVVLVQGNPEQGYVDNAFKAMDAALSFESYKKLDEEARAATVEKVMAEQAAKEAARAVIEAQISSQQESLRQLQASLAAQ
jgi:hypothetical protein